MGIVSKVVSTVRKIDSIHAMVEGAVKKIDEVYVFVEGKRHLVFPESTLIYEKTTGGSYSFTVPEKYNYVMIEYAGGAGGGIVGSGSVPSRNGGGGSIKKINKSKISNKTIYCIVGAKGDNGGTTTSSTPAQGGAGYSAGENGTVGDKNLVGLRQESGAGGGSTSVKFNNVVYEASAGGGAFTQYAGSYGGKGGGVYGGARQTSYDNGNNATDPSQIGLNSGNGYVRIYGIAG